MCRRLLNYIRDKKMLGIVRLRLDGDVIKYEVDISGIPYDKVSDCMLCINREYAGCWMYDGKPWVCMKAVIDRLQWDEDFRNKCWIGAGFRGDISNRGSKRVDLAEVISSNERVGEDTEGSKGPKQ